jgi:hypothetical protein
MKMPNFVSAKFFELCIQEDGDLTFPDKRMAKISNFVLPVALI